MFVSQHSLARAARKFVPGPPRHLNEARFPTVDRKSFSLKWNGSSKIDITLQDRATSITYPMSLRKDAGKFVSCFQEGGIVSMKPSKDSSIELRVGSDRGILYFSLKGEEGTITTGLGPGEAAIANALVLHAERELIAGACS